MIICINTASSEAQLALYSFKGAFVVGCSFPITNDLSSELLKLTEALFIQSGFEVKQLSGVVCVVGPGRFTSVRLGVVYANALALSYSVSLIGVDLNNSELEQGVKRLLAGENDTVLTPHYSEPPRIG